MTDQRWKIRITRLAIAAAATLALPAQAATQAQINAAIDSGLAYLASTQQANGSWNYGSYDPAATGAAAYAMLSQKNLWGVNAVAYQTSVDNALGYLLSNATLQPVSTRNDGVNICPGGGTCAGVYWNAANNEDSYTTGLIAPAIALYAQSMPGAVATASGPLAGMTWGQIAQAVTNLWSASQSTANQGNRKGGWRYILGGPGYDSDMSTTQWGSVSLAYMQTLGATTPAIVKTDLAAWLAATQSVATGAGCYQPGNSLCDHSDTGGLLLSHAFLGKTSSDPAVASAIAFLDNNWGQSANGTWYGNFAHPYAMWSVYKGLETTIGLADNSHISLLPSECGTLDVGTTCNWWQDYNDFLVNDQNGNGSWNGYAHWTGNLATSFYLPILGGTLIPNGGDTPEPAILALIGLALAGLAASRRRRGG